MRAHRGPIRLALIELYTARVDQADSTINARRGTLHFGVTLAGHVYQLMFISVRDNEPLLSDFGYLSVSG